MMVKFILASFSLLFLMTCDKEIEDCSAVSCLAQTITLEVVDSEGADLIENGTYPIEHISVAKGENEVNAYQDALATGVQFFLSGTEGENIYTLTLNDAETETLVLNLSIANPGSECCSPIFEIDDATYNGSTIEVINENNVYKIIIVKPLG